MTQSRSNFFSPIFHTDFHDNWDFHDIRLINRNIVPTPPHYDTQLNNAIFDLKIDISLSSCPFFVFGAKIRKIRPSYQLNVLKIERKS